jgi:hypothetical protein
MSASRVMPLTGRMTSSGDNNLASRGSAYASIARKLAAPGLEARTPGREQSPETAHWRLFYCLQLSPILTGRDIYFQLHFQFGANGFHGSF